MKKRILLLVVFILIVSGVGTSSGRKYIRYANAIFVNTLQQKPVDTSDSNALASHQKNYLKIRDSIAIQRKKLRQQYVTGKSNEDKDKVLKEAGRFLREALVKKIYPTWYGTEWDFNGITETPCQGKIACGYFVSTTLKHAGVNVNRYKLAQKYSHAIVKSICSDIKTYHSMEDMIEFLENKEDDIFVVGLDNHVGILSKEGNDLTFIHSSFMYPSHVVSEEAQNSIVLGTSRVYVLGNLTSNEVLLKAWLHGSVVTIVE